MLIIWLIIWLHHMVNHKSQFFGDNIQFQVCGQIFHMWSKWERDTR